MKIRIDPDHIPWPLALALVPLLCSVFLAAGYLSDAGYDLRWLLIPGSSLSIFIYVLPTNQQLWRETWFWALCAGLFVAGAVGWALFLMQNVKLPIFGYTLLCILQCAAVVVVIGLVEDAMAKKRAFR